jgi:branched-chain amino acid transport system ATP-binding protein
MSDAVLLKVENMTKRFGGLTAIENLSFEVRHNEILGLIGPNGAGKSTTFNVASGFYRASAGRIWFEGTDISRLSVPRISHLGLVRTFQHESFMPEMTVYENILIGTFSTLSDAQKRHDRIVETAEILNLSNYLNEEAGSLPHGVQRMVSIAIAFASRPKLLCLDEPLTGLNQTEVQRALAVFRRIKEEFKISILLVEHNMKAVMNICDRIVVLDYGVFLADGTPQEIKSNPKVIAAYLGRRHEH